MAGPRWVRRVVAFGCLLALSGSAAAVGTLGQPLPAAGTGYGAAPAQRAAARPPNIVLVVMDDLSLDLVQTMRTAAVMRRRGASYSHAFVADSLCCVSRTSLFTGQYPHQTGVRTNTSGQRGALLGGWSAFTAHGNPARSVNVALQAAGYTTGFVGKYLNEYEYVPGRAVPPAPPGWSQFNAVFGSGYDGWDFHSSSLRAGRLRIRHHPAPPESAGGPERDRAYAGRAVERYALRFLRRHADDDAPYFLQVSTYAPHNRTQPKPYYPGDPVFPPMYRDRPAAGRPGNCGPVACSSLTVRDLPGFGDDPGDNRPRRADGRPARAWNTRANPFRPAEHVNDLRNRAMMVQSVDRTVARILRRVGEDTYVVLTSDNGFHLGQNGLARGKGTAYDTDVHVPLLLVGPGVVPGVRREVTSNIDLAPTFEELAGLAPAPYRSGVSLVPTFADPALVRRGYAFVEHTAQSLTRSDPDAAFTGDELDRIPSYLAVRSRTGLLVRYDLAAEADRTRYGYEFYSYRRLRWERKNTVHQARHAAEVALLSAKLAAFDRCASATGDQRVTPACRAITS